MYHAYIGRKIVGLHNKHYHDGDDLSPEEYFDNEFFPLMFDDPDYLFWGGNDPFSQKYIQGKRKGEELTHERRREALSEFHDKVQKLEAPEFHLFQGGHAKSFTETTSGQVTTMDRAPAKQEVYCSWFGAAAAIGVTGGLSILIDHEKILLALMRGWKEYRKYLQQTPKLKPRQLQTWNGWWITHRFGYDFHEDDFLRDFDPDTGKSGGDIKLNTQDWIKVLFTLAREINEQNLTAYVFSFGQTNQTVGFRQLQLPKISYLTELYEELFGDRAQVDARQLSKVYETENSFYVACEQGAIGLSSIEPKKLRDYMPGGNKTKWPKYEESSDNEVQFLIFQTWIIAMLNNEELIEFTEHLAEVLTDYAKSAEKGRTTPKRQAEQVIDSDSQRAFLEELTNIIEENEEHAELLSEVADEVVKMPNSDFPLFVTLLRLKYAAQNA